MNEPRFPAGWDAERVKRLIDHYESMSEEELAEEDDAAVKGRKGRRMLQIIKGERYQKVIGLFGEAFVCNWLSRSGFEAAVVDHVGLDIVAYHVESGKRLGITVKARTRVAGKESESVTIFSYEKDSNDREKLKRACTVFNCEPWVAVYVEFEEAGHLFLTSLDNFDQKYRSQKVDRASDTWKMSKKKMEQYVQDPAVCHLSVKFEASNWEWSSLGMKDTTPAA